MNSDSKVVSWIELTIKLCDQVLEKAAQANPANILLRDLAFKLQYGILA
jgi:hypothetical protein